jgi:hypothetical protein
MATASDVRQALLALADPMRVQQLNRFFQTAPGQYGEGDRFIGPPVPAQRAVAKSFRDLPPEEVEKLVENPFHECRFVGLIIWCLQVTGKRTPPALRHDRATRYLRLRTQVNNWDLVDTTAPTLLGEWLLLPEADRSVLDELAASDHLWSQRMAMITTLAFIRKGQFADTVRLAEALLGHHHDLIHKAVGWMLREMGQRNVEALHEFLATHLPQIPRTALRYAIEKLPAAERQAYLAR